MASNSTESEFNLSWRIRTFVIRNKRGEGTKQAVFKCMMTEHRLSGSSRGGGGGSWKDRADHINNNNYICTVIYGSDALPIML